MAPLCSNCGGTEFVWAGELKTGGRLAQAPLALRSGGELPLGTRICRACGHADLFLRDITILQNPHHWRPNEFVPISSPAAGGHAAHASHGAEGGHAKHAADPPSVTATPMAVPRAEAAAPATPEPVAPMAEGPGSPMGDLPGEAPVAAGGDEPAAKKGSRKRSSKPKRSTSTASAD